MNIWARPIYSEKKGAWKPNRRLVFYTIRIENEERSQPQTEMEIGKNWFRARIDRFDFKLDPIRCFCVNWSRWLVAWYQYCFFMLHCKNSSWEVSKTHSLRSLFSTIIFQSIIESGGKTFFCGRRTFSFLRSKKTKTLSKFHVRPCIPYLLSKLPTIWPFHSGIFYVE